jgi:hypothetical protein
MFDGGGGLRGFCMILLYLEVLAGAACQSRTSAFFPLPRQKGVVA